MVVPADRLGEQLGAKVRQLRALTDRIRDDLLDQVTTQAQDPDAWSGGPQRAFCGWLDALRSWTTLQLARALEDVTNRVAEQLNDRTSAQAALVTGIPGATMPAPPGPFGTTVPPPPPFHMATTRDRNPRMHPERLRAGLVNALGQTRDQVLNLSRRLDELLTEPVPNPLPLGIAGPVIPARVLPPDAKQAAGVPAAFNAFAGELDRALLDILDRAKKWDDAMVASSATPGLTAFVAHISALGVEAGYPPPEMLVMGMSRPTECPTSVKTSADPNKEASAAAAAFAKVANRPFFGKGDQRDLAKVLREAGQYADDPAFASAFIAAFVPEGLRRWCKLANNSVIDLQTTTELLSPLSRLLSTATRAPNGLDPKVRKTLLGSRCLDTIVQFGAFDESFAVEAAQRILKNPGYYERSDNTDRVYASLDRKGNYISGDARYGALQLLANNPGAAQHFFEKAEGVRRMDMLNYLEDGGLVGEAAARALEAGLHDLSRKESVDTLELALRLTAHGNLHPEGAGKAALAHLISREQLRGDLFASVARPEGDSTVWVTDAKGWNIPGQTLGKAFASIVDDAKARADLLVGLSDQANSFLAEQTQALAGADPASFDEAMKKYFAAVGKIGLVFRAVADGGAEAGKAKKPNAAGVAAIELAISQAAKLLPGGAVVVDTAKVGVRVGKEQILERMEKDRRKKVDPEGIKAELVDKLKIYAVLNLFTEERLVASLIPPNSVLRGPDGRIHVPEPPIGGIPNTEWNHFLENIETTGPPISNVVNDAALRVEAFIR